VICRFEDKIKKENGWNGLAAEEWHAQEMAHTSVWHVILQPPNADPVPIHPPPKDFGKEPSKDTVYVYASSLVLSSLLEPAGRV
jgi:hypothetical protein